MDHWSSDEGDALDVTVTWALLTNSEELGST
jgi:hypothetical protein